MVEAAQELLAEGTYGYLKRTGLGLQAARPAFAEAPEKPAT
jgi:hypothetical protein